MVRNAVKPPARKQAKKSAPRREARSTRKPKVVARTAALTVTEVTELDDLRRELERTAAASPLRWNADPDDVQRSVAQLVLTLVEFVRKLLERQPTRGMKSGRLTVKRTKDAGLGLLKPEET